MQTTVRAASAAIGFAFVTATTASAALPPPRTICSVAKIKAASSSFACALKQQARAAAGGSADTASCAEKLAKRFATAERRGGCATTGDDALAASRSIDAAAEVANLLGSSLVLDSVQLKCLKQKTKLAARYAACQTAAFVNRLTDNYIGERDDFTDCRLDHANKSAALDLPGTCPTTGEAADVQASSAAGYGFAPSLLLDYGQLQNAPLSHGYFPGSFFSRCSFDSADLREADFSGTTVWGGSFSTGEFDVPTDLRDTNFSGASVEASHFNRAKLDGADMAGATLDGIGASTLGSCPASLPAAWRCVSNHIVGPTAVMNSYQLSGADLSGTDLSHAFVVYASLIDANLQNADLSEATIEYSALRGADMNGANLGNAFLRGVSGTGLASCPASLPANYSCVKNNLIGFEGHLDGADLVNADMSGVVAEYMRFFNSDLTGANWAGATLRGTTFYNTTCPDGVIATDCCNHGVGGAPLVCN